MFEGGVNCKIITLKTRAMNRNASNKKIDSAGVKRKGRAFGINDKILSAKIKSISVNKKLNRVLNRTRVRGNKSSIVAIRVGT
jgi:hypothetical protein